MLQITAINPGMVYKTINRKKNTSAISILSPSFRQLSTSSSALQWAIESDSEMLDFSRSILISFLFSWKQLRLPLFTALPYPSWVSYPFLTLHTRRKCQTHTHTHQHGARISWQTARSPDTPVYLPCPSHLCWPRWGSNRQDKVARRPGGRQDECGRCRWGVSGGAWRPWSCSCSVLWPTDWYWVTDQQLAACQWLETEADE